MTKDTTDPKEKGKEKEKEKPEPSDAHLENSRLNLSDMYNNSFLMLTKYADLSIGVRHGIFVQGIVVLSGTALLLSQKQYVWAVLSSVFCFSLAVILNILHKHYNAYFFDIRSYIQSIEDKYGPQGISGYVKYVETRRDIRVNKPKFGSLKNFGPFHLVQLASLVLLVISISMFTKNELRQPPIPDTTQTKLPEYSFTCVCCEQSEQLFFKCNVINAVNNKKSGSLNLREKTSETDKLKLNTDAALGIKNKTQVNVEQVPIDADIENP